MALITTQQAAELTRRNRTTIWRACKTGRVSATKSDGGDFLIDPAELERVYGTLRLPAQPSETLQSDAVQPDATTNETNVLHREIDLLRERVRSLEGDKDDLRSERDRLLSVLEKQTEHVKLLTDQRSRPSWWSRLTGRAA